MISKGKMRRLLARQKPRSIAATAPLQTGAIYTLPRLLGSTSTFALLDASAAAARGLSAGTNANLTLTGGNQISATVALTAGASQSAAVEERSADGSAAVARMVTLTGIGTAPGAAITASPASPSIATSAIPGSTIVTLANVPAGVAPTISPNDGRFRVAGSEAAGWRVVVGLSALSAGSVTLTAAATGATSASIPLTIINGAAPAIAPTVVAAGGDGRSALTITDTNPASANVQCWNIYESTTSGSGYPTTPTQIAYRIDQVARMSLANGNTRYYKVAAYNRLGEGPMSAEVSATSSSANYNPLRVNATIWFAGVLNYTMIQGDYKSGATVSVTCSDGTVLSQKTQNGAIIVYGTFATVGQKTLTFTEGPGGNVSTQVINVVAVPAAATKADVYANAAAIKARMNAKPTYTASAGLSVTDSGYISGNAPPGGYFATNGGTNGTAVLSALPNSAYPGASEPIASQAPTSLTISRVWVPARQGVLAVRSNQTSAANTKFRLRLFKQTWFIGISSDPTACTHFVVRYSDDNGATWTETVRPTYVAKSSGQRFFKIDPGSVPPSGGRIFEVELSKAAAFFATGSTNGFWYETGETPQAVVDLSPAIRDGIDSFGAGEGSMDQSKNRLVSAARALGLTNYVNHGINTQRYTLPTSATGALAIDRYMGSTLGLDEANMHPIALDFLTWTINDGGQGDTAQLQAIFTNLFYLARWNDPNRLFVVSLGFWSPQDVIPSGLRTAFRAAFNTVFGADAGAILNDGVADGWAVASGATGSSPYWFNTNQVSFTGSASGTTLTVTSPTGGNVEAGMYLYDTSGTWVISRVVRQLTGTPGGAGTYELDQAANGGDIASSSISLRSENYVSGYPVHPNPAGQTWCGDRYVNAPNGAAALVNRVLA